MNEAEVKQLMQSSKTEEEWNANCDEVKRRCDGYPDFWFGFIIMSGLLANTRTANGW